MSVFSATQKRRVMSGSAFTLLLFGLVSSSNVDASDGKYHRCKIMSGRVSFCEPVFTGRAVVQKRDGKYAECKITSGTKSTCDMPYTGSAVVMGNSKKYARCRLRSGEVTSCGPPFSGYAVVKR